MLFYMYFHCQKCIFDIENSLGSEYETLTFVKTLKVKPESPPALAGGVRLPEEVATACLALSLGERDQALHPHPPPASSFLLLLLGQEEHLPLCSHHLGHKLQQDQESQVLKTGKPG